MQDYRILTSEAEIEAIADEWRQLHDRAGRNYFSDYETFAIWWRIIGRTNKARRLHIVTSRRDGALVGLLPLCVIHRKGVRIMQAAGHESYAFDMLAEDMVQATELWHAARRSPHYDFADLRDVYPDTLAYAALERFAHRRDMTEAYCLNINWATGTEWIASMPSRINHDPQRRLRRLVEKGPVRFEVHKNGSPPPAIIEAMVRQKKAWTVEREKHGFFDHPAILSYFREVVETAARQRQLFLSWLSCGDDIIAYDQGFIYKGVLRNFTITHDPAWSAYSPGILILRHSVCWAIDNGLRVFHHGQGYGNYKANYSNEVQRCTEFMFSGSLKGRLLESVFFHSRTASRFIKQRKNRARKKS